MGTVVIEGTRSRRPERLDYLFMALASAVRREVIQILVTREACSLASLSRELDTRHRPSATSQKALHHIHLPKLEAAGLIEYDTDQRQICSTFSTADAIAAIHAATSEIAEPPPP